MDDLLKEAKDTYRVPAEAPYEAIWTRIEREHFDTPRAVAPLEVPHGADRQGLRRRGWLQPAIGIAATLLVGFGVGRFTAGGSTTSGQAGSVAEQPRSNPSASVTPVKSASNVSEPLQRATYEYVSRAVALLDSLPQRSRSTLGGDARFVADASQLLSTTRVLLDSPAASDPRLRNLLEDLELVLAQITRLRTAPRADELTFIAQAMDERDVVLRLRTVVATIEAGY